MKVKWTFALMTVGLLVTSCGIQSTDLDLADLQTESPEIVVTLLSDAVGITMTNAAAAGTELSSNVSRAYIDFSSFSSVRAHFASSLNSALIQCRIDYSLDDGTTWATLVPAFSALTVANANSTSAWGAIPDNANTSVMVRGVIIGNGVLDPVIRYVRIGYY